MALKTTPFVFTACNRCEMPVLRGWWSGFDMQLERRTVPLKDAIVLDRYGRREVVVLEKQIRNLAYNPIEFSPRAEVDHHYRNGHKRLYAVNHVCGTRHDPRR